MAFGTEIKRLREEANISAQKLADLIGIDADRLRKWEQKDLTPRDEDTAKIESFFQITLVEIMALESIKKFLNLPIRKAIHEPFKPFLKVRQEKKTQPDPENDGIIYVPIAAQAGYTNQFHDPIYLNHLERVNLPGFPYRGDRYRVFDVKGDSMEPTYKEGYHLVCEAIEQDQWHQIANWYIYVIVLENDIIVKRLFKKDKEIFAAISDNEEFYPQFKIEVKDIKELWLVKRKIDWDMAPPKKFDITV